MNCPKKDIASAVLRVWMCCSLLCFMVSFQLSFSFRHKICWAAVKCVSSFYWKDRKQFSSVGRSKQLWHKNLEKLRSGFRELSILVLYKWKSIRATVKFYYFPVTPVHAVKAYGGSGDVAPIIFNLRIKLDQLSALHPRTEPRQSPVLVNNSILLLYVIMTRLMDQVFRQSRKKKNRRGNGMRVYHVPVLARLFKCAIRGSASVDFSSAAQRNASSGIRTRNPIV
jgi:hypothetical protein